MTRTFSILIKAPGKPVMSLPCGGCPEYTGEQALKVMESYSSNRKLVETMARTVNPRVQEGFELLDLAEMREMYKEEAEK